MGIKVKTVAIDGVQYQFTQLGAVEGKDFFHDLRKVALPAFRTLLTGDLVKVLAEGDPKALENLEASKVGELLGLVLSLFENMPKQLERDLTTAFAKNCKYANAETQHAFVDLGDANLPNGIFDQHFAGEYLSLQKWLLVGLRFNFARFLGDLRSALSSANPPTQATP